MIRIFVDTLCLGVRVGLGVQATSLGGAQMRSRKDRLATDVTVAAMADAVDDEETPDGLE